MRTMICSPASSDTLTSLPNCDAAFDVPLYAAAAAAPTPCSRPTLSTKHDFACCTSSNEIRLETHFAIFAVSLDACFCTYMQLCNYASEPLLPVWCSTGFLLPPRLAEMFHARGETLTCYYFRASERDVYSAVSPGEPRLEDRLRRPKDMLRQRALSMHLLMYLLTSPHPPLH